MLVPDQRSAQSEQRASGPRNEGEAAKQLLEKYGFLSRRVAPQNGQYEFKCPFHEEEGSLGRNEKTHFYLDAKTSQYYCQAASCGESGNLQTLSKFFGVNDDPQLLMSFKSKNVELQKYQARLTTDLRQVLYEKGLNDEIIDRFRIGYRYVKEPTEGMTEEQIEECKNSGGYYVIPYLEGRRPVAFRYYDPVQRGVNEKGKPMYGGPNGSKYWWERQNDTVREDPLRLFNPGHANGDERGRVYICEGEFKAMLLARNGKMAVSLPGAANFKPEWAQYFMHAKDIVIVLDNDNPAVHQRENCRKCGTVEKADCAGHNPGQDAATKLLDFFGHRARNVVLPLPEGAPKTDINEFIMRDGQTFMDFDMLVDGKPKVSPFVVQTFAQIRQAPPEEAVFLVDNGLLPKGGRLLITGAPKVGKSIFAQNLACSIAAGIPFLATSKGGGFPGFGIANSNPTPGHRVLLLDRELSKRSLYDRLNTLMDGRPGYQLAEEKLLIDHDFALRLDADNAANQLINLVTANSAEVVILDTAYKFFGGGDFESSRSLTKVFAVLDEVIAETGVSIILTHHQKKGSNARNEMPDVDSVAGSFLWTGWVNGTVLLNFKERSVANPYDVICSFTAFRDAAAPDPLLLKRGKESINYTEIAPFKFSSEDDEDEGTTAAYRRVHAKRLPLSTENVANVLLEVVPVIEDEFLHMASARFGCQPGRIKMHLIDIMDTRKDFERVGSGKRGDPYTWKYAFDKQEESYDQPELSAIS